MEPKIAQKGPYLEKLEAKKEYLWCACGQSKNQPFCDDSHKGTEYSPVAFTPKSSGKSYLCGCKRTKTKPFCDGSHTKL
jgi:CDGSH iron-sulfur domain-containing protein 3